jgi:hypothetical protein
MYGEDDGGFIRRETQYDEPFVNDEVLCCPDCETPNQFGELCFRCQRERDQDEPYQQDMEIEY